MDWVVDGRTSGWRYMGRHWWEGVQEVTCRRVFCKQADQRQPRGDRHCGRETLPAPTGDTGVHFLWNASGIAGNRPTSTTSPARGGHILWLRAAGAPLLGSCTPAVCPGSIKVKKKFAIRGQIVRKARWACFKSTRSSELEHKWSFLLTYFINLIAALIWWYCSGASCSDTRFIKPCRYEWHLCLCTGEMRMILKMLNSSFKTNAYSHIPHGE